MVGHRGIFNKTFYNRLVGTLTDSDDIFDGIYLRLCTVQHPKRCSFIGLYVSNIFSKISNEAVRCSSNRRSQTQQH